MWLNKIGFKLILAVGITTIIIIGVYSYFNIVSQSEALLAEVERHAIQQSETIKSSTRYGMLLNQREHIHENINTIGSQPYITGVRVFNKEGEIIYSANNNDIGNFVDKNAESCYACHIADQPLERLTTNERTRIFRLHKDSSRVLGVINPIYSEQSCWDADCHAHSKDQKVLGVLDITVCLVDLDEQIEKSKIKVVIFAVFSIFAISSIIGLFVKKWVDKPVTDLVDATKLVASGNFIYKIKNISKDELGDLQKSFNLMTKKLAEARKQLFQSDKMASLGRLAAGVAHEINNPLTGILSYSSFLLKRAGKNSELKNDLKVIVSETMRCRDIVKSLLDFARQSVPKKNKSDINQIIERSLTVVENQLNIKKINVIKNFASKLPEIIVDLNQIQQVFVNLIVNAADAVGGEGGTITLSTSLIRLSPYGITQIKNATCPKNHNLMDNDFKINGMPSIKMKAKTDGSEGYINFDPIYGKHKNHYGLPFSKKKMVDLYCPECNTPMVDKTIFCPECNSPIFKIFTSDKGTIEGCTKLGCHWQRWKEIDFQGERQYIEIDVSDTGCGINKENIDRIYEPFYSTKGQKGTGLGLSVIWGIIDNHKGRITVKSEEGKGTNFIIRIPVGVN